MSPKRIIGEFLLDSLVGLLLYAIAMVVMFSVVGLLSLGFWFTGTIFYLAVSSVAFYARWRGHISFFLTLPFSMCNVYIPVASS